MTFRLMKRYVTGMRATIAKISTKRLQVDVAVPNALRITCERDGCFLRRRRLLRASLIRLLELANSDTKRNTHPLGR